MTSGISPRDAVGAETLDILAAAPRYNAWVVEVLSPYIGRRVLEVGAGIGNMSEHLLVGASHVVLTDLDAWYRQRLYERFWGRPNVRIDELKLPDPTAHSRFAADRLDTVVALNVVEHIEDDVGALRTMGELLVPGGQVVVAVPALQPLYGEMDRELGHFRRYNRRSLAKVFESAGLRAVRMFWFNRFGVLGWWFNGRIRKVSRIPLGQLRRFDTLVPILRFERFLPLPFGQSLIAIGTPE